MRSNRHKTSYYEQKTQLRDRQITDLGTVLQRQRIAIRQLLSHDKKDERHRRREVTLLQSNTETTQPQLYQRIYTQIVEIGNRVLPSARKEQRSNVLLTNKQKILEDIIALPCEVDKKNQSREYQYLKSSQYRNYLQNITSGAEGSDNLLKKMKAARNNNAYLNNNNSRSPRPSATPRSDRLESQRQNKEDAHRVNKEGKLLLNRQYSPINSHRDNKKKSVREQKQNKKDQTLNLDMQVLEEQLERLTTKREELPVTKLIHTPTMKQLHAPQVTLTPKKQTEERKLLSEKIKLESKTIDFMMEAKTKQNVKQLVQVKQQKPHQLKQWNLQYVTKSVGKRTNRKKTIISKPFVLKDFNKLAQKTVKHSIESQQVKYCKNNNIQCFEYVQSGKNNKENHYNIDFKLQRPGNSVRQSNKIHKVFQENKYRQYNYQEYLHPEPRQLTPTKRFPIFDVNQPKGMFNSQSASTLSQQKPLTPSRSAAKSQLKLKVVTPSRLAKR